MSTDINTILSWFETGDKPTQAQFWASWQSFWHKDEILPQSSVYGLLDALRGISITKAELDFMIAGKTLVPMQLYIIFGVDAGLYGGTTIYMRAISQDALAPDGVGEFYNPKYDQSVNGYSIWTPNDSYAIDDTVIWGGLHWKNLTGNVGSQVDIFTLNEDWEAIPYNENDYNLAYDAIRYDHANDLIIYRNERECNIVSFSKSFIDFIYDISSYIYKPIKAFQWGNMFTLDFENGNGYRGIGYQRIMDSYNENINFRGWYQAKLLFTDFSIQINSSFENSIQENIVLSNYSSQNNLNFSNSGQYYLILNNSNQSSLYFNNGNQSNFLFNNNSSQSYLTFNDGSQSSLTFNNNSRQENINLTSGSQSQLTFSNASSQIELTLEGSYQDTLVFDSYSSQSNLTLLNSSQEKFSFENSEQNFLIASGNTQQEFKFVNSRVDRTGMPFDGTAEKGWFVFDNDFIKGVPQKRFETECLNINNGLLPFIGQNIGTGSLQNGGAADPGRFGIIDIMAAGANTGGIILLDELSPDFPLQNASAEIVFKITYPSSFTIRFGFVDNVGLLTPTTGAYLEFNQAGIYANMTSGGSGHGTHISGISTNEWYRARVYIRKDSVMHFEIYDSSGGLVAAHTDIMDLPPYAGKVALSAYAPGATAGTILSLDYINLTLAQKIL